MVDKIIADLLPWIIEEADSDSTRLMTVTAVDARRSLALESKAEVYAKLSSWVLTLQPYHSMYNFCLASYTPGGLAACTFPSTIYSRLAVYASP